MDRDPISLAARVAALTCVLACAWLPGAARAYVVTYDFAGTGQVCDYVDGGAGTRCADGTAFIGAITLDVDERGPLGADASVRGTFQSRRMSPRSSRSTTFTLKPLARRCSTHLPQQPQVGVL